MTQRRLASAALVTVTVITGAIVLTSTGHGTRLVATFSDVRGLVAGADVRIAGERVGRVDHVGLDHKALPAVSMTLDRGVTVHRGLTASMRLASLSGEFNRYVALTDGGGSRLGGKVALGLRSTRAPVEFDQALQALGPRTRSDVRAVLHGLEQAGAGRGGAVAETLRTSAGALAGAAEALRQLDSDGAALKQLVTSTATVSSTLARGRGDVGRATDQVASLLGVSAQRAGELRTTLGELPSALASTTGALDQAQAAIPSLRTLIGTAAPGIQRLGPVATQLAGVLQTSAPLLARAATTAGHTPADLRAVRSLLSDTRPFVGQVTPVLERLGPMLDQARVRLPDFFSFFSNWADFTSNYDANGHGARVGIVLPPTSTRRLAPDSNRAGQLAPPFLRTPGALEGVPWHDYARSFVAGGTAAADVGGGR
jgi:phospholipid/cholesterol/gamma-HCH transport system substrate-binding protein